MGVVKASLLEHLTGTMPYELAPVISHWQYDEDWQMLKVAVNVDTKSPSQHKYCSNLCWFCLSLFYVSSGCYLERRDTGSRRSPWTRRKVWRNFLERKSGWNLVPCHSLISHLRLLQKLKILVFSFDDKYCRNSGSDRLNRDCRRLCLNTKYEINVSLGLLFIIWSGSSF